MKQYNDHELQGSTLQKTAGSRSKETEMPGLERSPVLLAEAWEEPGDLNAVQKRILRKAREAFQADICTLFSINPITGDFVSSPFLEGDLHHPEHLEFTQPRPQGITRRVLEDGQLLVEELIGGVYDSPFAQRESVQAFAAVALKAHPHPKSFAVVYIDYRQSRCFDEHYRQVLQQFAQEASMLLQNAWLLYRYRRVIGLGQEINQELDTVENLFHLVDNHISQILDTSYFLMLGTYSEQGRTLDLYRKYKSEFSMHLEHELTPGCQWVIRRREPLVIHDYDPRVASIAFVDLYPKDPEDPRSLIFLPLLLRGIPLGVLSLQHPAPHAYDGEDLHILEILGNHIASALSNIRLFNDLRQLNATGQLLVGQSEGQDVLENTVQRIKEATRADLVILYPYHQDRDTFDLPPKTAGVFLEPDFPLPESCERPASPYRVVDLEEPRFLEDASSGPALQLLSSVPGQRSDFQRREDITSVAALPLRVGGETVGALYLNYRRRQISNARQKYLISSLAIFAAIAIKNAWKFGRHGQELAVLNLIDNKLRQAVSLEDILRTVLEESNKIVKAESAFILLVNSETRDLEFAARVGAKPKIARGGVTHWVFEHREPVNIANVKVDPKWCHIYVEAVKTTVSELAAPLLDGDRVIGVLNFESPQEAAFSKADESFVQTLAGQVVLAVKKAQLYQKTSRLAKERETLISLTKQIVGQLDLQKLLDLILEKAIATSKASAGVLLLYDAPSQHLVIRSEQGADKDSRGERIPASKGIVGKAARERRIQYAADLANPEWSAIYLNYASGMRSALAVPLRSGGTLWGVLNLESPKADGFSAEHRHLVLAFADVAVVALQNAHSHESARRELSRFEALVKAGLQLAQLGNSPGEHEKGEACRIVTTQASEHRDCRAVVRIYVPETEDLVLVHAADPWTSNVHKRIKIGQGVNGWVFAHRRTHNCPDTQNIPSGEPQPNLADPETRSLLVTPIQLGDTYYGNLALSERTPYFFDATDIELAEGLARLLAITFHRLDAIQQEQELQERQRQAKTMSTIGQAAYSLAHRLGDMLGWIPSYVNLILDGLRNKSFHDSEIEEQLVEIGKAASRVQDLSAKLREETQSLKPSEPCRIEIPLLFQEVLDEFRKKSPSFDITVEISTNTGTINAIRDHPREILFELVKNSIEAMPQGGIIQLKAYSSPRQVHIQVIDRGEGIQPENLGQIFEFLYSTKGGGFGLWSAKQKADLNGGTLEAESVPQKGSTFTLTLPRADQELEAQYA